MLRAAASLCFLGFFRSGEITVPSIISFDACRHLAWEDVTVDSKDNPQAVKVYLKTSKTDQLERGMDVYISKTDSSLCPLTVVMHYMIIQDSKAGPFLFLRMVPHWPNQALQPGYGKHYRFLISQRRTLLATTSSNNSGQCKDRRLCYQDNGEMVKLNIPGLHLYTQGTTCGILKVTG